MGFRALDYNISIIGTKKNEIKYGMCCAWVMQVDYDKLVCLIGVQSVTGSILAVGDKVGVLYLYKDGKKISSFDITVKESVKKANIWDLYKKNFKYLVGGNI